MRLCTVLAVVFPILISALTDDEISQFQTSGQCLPAALSTSYQTDLCGHVSITETDDGESLVVQSNSIPDHEILKDYYYRDTVQGDFCLSFNDQEFSITIPKNPTKNSEPSCVPSTSGVALNGVHIWNPYNPESLLGALPQYADFLEDVADGVDAGRGFMGEPVDVCGGHPGPNGTAVSSSLLITFS
jgi:hypothetical protein